MVQYSFKHGFLEAIRTGETRQTIRHPRKRPTRVGDALQIVTGSRFHPQRVGFARCVAARLVRLDFEANVVEFDDAVRIETEGELNAFAIRDGFSTQKYRARGFVISPWSYMTRWWALTHPGQPVFAGALVDWDDTFTVEPPQ
jgi:hypothetical protein